MLTGAWSRNIDGDDEAFLTDLNLWLTRKPTRHPIADTGVEENFVLRHITTENGLSVWNPNKTPQIMFRQTTTEPEWAFMSARQLVFIAGSIDPRSIDAAACGALRDAAIKGQPVTMES